MCLTSVLGDGQEMQLSYILSIRKVLSLSLSLSLSIIFERRNKFEVTHQQGFYSDQTLPALIHQPVSTL